MIAARPLTIAEIFDHTVAIVVQRWRVVLAFVAIAALPDALIIVVTRGHETTGSAVIVELIASVFVGALVCSPLARMGGEPGAPDDFGALLRRAAGDYWRSLGSFILIYAVLFVSFLMIVVVVGGAAIGARLIAGPGGFSIVAIVLGLPALVLIVPVFTLTSVAYANVILERVSPWDGLMSAVARFRRATLSRTWLLSAALLIVSFVPTLVLDPMLRPLSAAPGMWWILLSESFLTVAAGGAFGTVAGAIAAVDYRNRSEGADLHAVLDAPASAS